MANYQSQYSGETIEQLLTAVGKNVSENETISGITFRQVIWEVIPTTSNTVYGFAVHPTNGKLYRIKSVNNTKTAEVYSPTGQNITVNNNTLEIIPGD